MKQSKNCLLSLLVLAGVAGVTLTTGCTATATRQSTGEYIDDTAVTARVKGRLVADETVKALDVQVETFRGVVQLSGFVDNDTQRNRAEQIARTTNGVTEVQNNIQLKTSANDNMNR